MPPWARQPDDLVLAGDDVARDELRLEGERRAALAAEPLVAARLALAPAPDRLAAARAEAPVLGHLGLGHDRLGRVAVGHRGDVDQAGAELAADAARRARRRRAARASRGGADGAGRCRGRGGGGAAPRRPARPAPCRRRRSSRRGSARCSPAARRSSQRLLVAGDRAPWPRRGPSARCRARAVRRSNSSAISRSSSARSDAGLALVGLQQAAQLVAPLDRARGWRRRWRARCSSSAVASPVHAASASRASAHRAALHERLDLAQPVGEVREHAARRGDRRVGDLGQHELRARPRRRAGRPRRCP